MYNNGVQLFGAGATAGASVAALPLTSGNSVFQSLLIGTAMLAMMVLMTRVVKIISKKQSDI